jgi:hypothetical protein
MTNLNGHFGRRCKVIILSILKNINMMSIIIFVHDEAVKQNIFLFTVIACIILQVFNFTIFTTGMPA